MSSDPPAKLQAEWDRKLAATGFRDLEARGDDRSLLNVHTPTADTYEAAASRGEHFALAEAYGRRFAKTWPNLDRRIWRMYCAGESYRVIARAVSRTSTRVHQRIDRIRKRMKQWRPGQFSPSSWAVTARLSDEHAALFQRWARERNIGYSELVRHMIVALASSTKRDWTP